MNIPNILKRVKDGKEFRPTYVGLIDPLMSRLQADDGEIDDVKWVSDTFYVGVDSGHTFVP